MATLSLCEDLFTNWQLLVEQGTFFKIDPLR